MIRTLDECRRRDQAAVVERLQEACSLPLTGVSIDAIPHIQASSSKVFALLAAFWNVIIVLQATQEVVESNDNLKSRSNEDKKIGTRLSVFRSSSQLYWRK